MQLLSSFRDPETGRALLEKVQDLALRVQEKIGRRPVFMEVCGTHTVAISKTGVRSLLQDKIDLRSGPGCPVCVTDYGDIDKMVAFGQIPKVTVGTFGDMFRVPGSYSSLEKERARGADIRIFYSPLEAVKWAEEYPEREMVFLGVGFETTTPASALSILEAQRIGLHNYSVFSVNKTVPPALHALLADPEIHLDGLLLPGHVSAIIGRQAYDFLAEDYRMPAIITGFEALDILSSIHDLLKQMLIGETAVRNGYKRVVREQGNVEAQKLLASFYEPASVSWRGFGVIPDSGLQLKSKFHEYDAQRRFSPVVEEPRIPQGCRCGDLLKGKLTPMDCPLFARKCTPSQPVGPCMVSSEGACAAFYQYERRERSTSNEQ